jgi:hypothetical protein
MSKSISGAFTKNKSDELYTPKILVETLRKPLECFYGKYIEFTTMYNDLTGHNLHENPVAWCPFDTINSEFIYLLESIGYHVKQSHINMGNDFFDLSESKEFMKSIDIIVSNPPFSRKLDVFKRLDELGKPWAMACNLMALNYQEIGSYFASNPCQLLIPDKRISFDGNPSSFCTGFVCKNLLISDLEFVHVEHNNVGSKYIPSRMHLDF